MDGYTQTIKALVSALRLNDSVLERRVLDVLPALIEQRSRHWTKGAHGYFTGSWSDGTGGGSAGKGLDKSGGSGIILTDKQRGKKIGEHARQWGLDPSLKEDIEQLIAIITDIFVNHDEVRIGSYRGQPDEVLFFAKGEDVVVAKQNNEFITVLKGGVHCARFKNAGKQKL